MAYYNNWIEYHFDKTFDVKSKHDSILNINFNVGNIKNLNYYDSLKFNAGVMRDTIREPFDVLFSGGVDSEVVVRIFKDMGILHNTYIFRYEDDMNVRDVNSAINICESLKIKYQIIDFNLKSFYNSSEAGDILEKTLIPSVAGLSKIKFLDYLDNVPVHGEGEPHWIRALFGDYGVKSDWKYHLSEYNLFYTLNQKILDRTIIGEWYLFTPEVTAAYFKLPLIQRLLNDEIIGKQGTISSKCKIHQDIWTDIVEREKLTGYEGPNIVPRSWGRIGSFSNNTPEIFKEFRNKNKIISDISNATFSYTVEQFKEIFKIP